MRYINPRFTYLLTYLIADNSEFSCHTCVSCYTPSKLSTRIYRILRIPYTDHVTNATVKLQASSLSSCLSSSRSDGFDFLDTWQGWICHLTSLEHSKCQSEGCPRIGDAHLVILVIPGYAPWKQISNLLILASTQHGYTLRIENSGSTSWKSLCSSSGHARDDDDDLL